MRSDFLRKAAARRRWGMAGLLGLVALALTTALPGAMNAQPPGGGKFSGGKAKSKAPPGKGGVSVNDPRAFQGYTLLAPMTSNDTFLLDMDGKTVKTWKSDCTPALSAYLLENGHLLRTGSLGTQRAFGGPGAGGRIQEFDWDGNIVWDYTYSNPTQLQHHDIRKLPNGNVLMVVWERKTVEEATAAGRRPELIKDKELIADCILEVKPTGKTTGEIVWEWHAWDHLVQDFDKAKPNYASISSRPERIDINFGMGAFARMLMQKDDLDKLRSLGYLGGTSNAAPTPAGSPPGGRGPKADWTHINSVAYNADLDQILLSSHTFSEIWIIDHSTTTAEAKGSTGGRHGKGGDLLYRWGNPRAYRSGTNADQRLFEQHDAQWIPKGRPGAGNILVFNNGSDRPDTQYSSVDEIVPPVAPDGKYTKRPGLAYGPRQAEWSYSAPTKTDFFDRVISGTQRQPNGNTLICSGTNQTVFEVTPDKATVWKYVYTVERSRLGRMISGMFGGPPGGRRFGPPPPQPGVILPPFLERQLDLTAEQKQKLDELQKDVNSKLDGIFTAEQKKQIQEIRESMGRGGPFGGPPGMGGPPGGRMGPGGGGGPGGLFRATRYAPDYPGLAGKDLKPLPKP